MAIDPSIPLQTQTANPMGMLSSVLNIKSQQQQLQNAQLANQQGQTDLQSSQIALQEKQGVQGVLKNIKQYQDSQGNIDYNRLMPDIMAVAPTTGAGVMNNVFQAQSAATNARKAVVGLDADTRNIVGNAMYSLKDQPPDVVQNTLQGLKTAYPTLGPAVDFFGKYIIGPNSGDPDQLNAHLDTAGKFIQSAGDQQSMNTPSGVTVNDGASTKVVSTKPGASVPVGQVVPGTQATMQLPPTQTTVLPNGQPGVVGPHASVDPYAAPGTASAGQGPTPEQSAPADFTGVQGPQRMSILRDIARTSADPGVRQQASQAVLAMNHPQGGQAAAPQFQAPQLQPQPGAPAPGGFLPTALPPGATEGITGPVAVANQHYAQVQADASAAPNRIAALQTIKQQIPTAIMGGGATGDFKRKFLSNVASVFGASADSTTSADIMAKNLAVLAAQGGNTDAARTLGEMGTPNFHMTADAAQRAVDQLVGIEAKKQAAAGFFSGTPTNTPAYANKMQMWNRYGDPRAFEYAAKSPADRATMRAEMQRAGTWDTLKNNMAHLDAMGVEPQ